MIKRFSLSALSALCLLAAPAVSFAQDAEKPAPTDDNYLIVTHLDYRKCVYPVCGGYFVKAVNKRLTQCADGSLQNECHAVELNTEALGWTDEQRATFDAQFASGHALVRGSINPAPGGFYTADVLTITEAWQGQGLRKPMGTYYGVKSTGIVCITAPCPSLAATKLNSAAPALTPDLDLSPSHASEKQIQAGLEALNTTGILAVGAIVPVKYPALEGFAARKGRKLLASEFYLPAKP